MFYQYLAKSERNSRLKQNMSTILNKKPDARLERINFDRVARELGGVPVMSGKENLSCSLATKRLYSVKHLITQQYWNALIN